VYLGSRYRLSFSEKNSIPKQGRKSDRHPTGRTGILRTRRTNSIVKWWCRSRKIERLNTYRPCRTTLSMTASSMVVIANSNSLWSSRSKNWPGRKKIDAAIVKSIKISRSHSSKSAPNQMRRLYKVNYSTSSIEWSLFEVLTHFLARDPEIWTIALVASTFLPNVDIGPLEQFNGVFHRAFTSELQLRLSLAKLIWASNSFLILRSKPSPHDWESWNQEVQCSWFFT
jgi:hypothetical protein